MTDDYDFRRVKRLGKVYRSPLFRLVVAPAKDKSKTRCGFVVSAKLDKRATVRNRIKRLLRESVRLILPRLKPGFDVVIIARSKMKGASFAKVNSEVNQVLSKVPLL